jgi:hypothetical protein
LQALLSLSLSRWWTSLDAAQVIPLRGIIDIPKVGDIDPVRGAELASYTALVSIINTKLPTVGELLLHQLVSQFRRASKTKYVKELLIALSNSHDPTGLFAIPRPHL